MNTHLLSIVPRLSNELPTLAALTARAPVGETMIGGALPRWLALVLDEIDYGVLLVGPDARVLYSNHAARRELRQGHPLSLEDGCLQARERAEGKAPAAALGPAPPGLGGIVSPH